MKKTRSVNVLADRWLAALLAILLFCGSISALADAPAEAPETSAEAAQSEPSGESAPETEPQQAESGGESGPEASDAEISGDIEATSPPEGDAPPETGSEPASADSEAGSEPATNPESGTQSEPDSADTPTEAPRQESTPEPDPYSATVPPEISEAPSAVPVKTLQPLATPGLTAAPSATSDANVTFHPAITPDPLATVHPTATIDPLATVHPTATIDPLATVHPTATIDPLATAHPTATVDPLATIDPLATPYPLVTVDPLATFDPFATIDPSATLDPFDIFATFPPELDEIIETPPPEATPTLSPMQLGLVIVDTSMIYTSADWAQEAIYGDLGMRIPQLYQSDYREVVCVYDGIERSVASSSCGGTSMSMVISYLTGNTTQTPYTVFKWGVHNGYYSGNGFGHSGLSAVAAHYGVDSEWVAATPNNVLGALQAGCPVIMHMGPGLFTRKGHYIVLRGVTDTGYILVNDPASRSRTQQAFSLSVILREAKTSEPVMVCSRAGQLPDVSALAAEDSLLAMIDLSGTDLADGSTTATPAPVPAPTVSPLNLTTFGEVDSL